MPSTVTPRISETDHPPSKVLVVGSVGHSRVKCVEWGALGSVNLVDHDAIVFNVRSLTEKLLRSIRLDYWENVRRALSRLLESRGELILLGDLARTVKLGNGSVTNYSWSPFQIGTRAEKGDTVIVKRERFPKLLSHFKEWDFYYFVPNACLSEEFTKHFGDTYNYKYELPIEPLVTNRYGEPLAGRIATRVRAIRDDTKVALGPITILPPVRSLDDRKAIGLLLEDLLGIPQSTLPPTWVESIEVPGNRELVVGVTSRQEKIRELNEEIGALQKEIADLNEVKVLLYGTGAELEGVVSSCLQKLGARVRPPRYSEEEFVVEWSGQTGLVECKGVGKSIALAHVRQLMDYMDKYEEDEGRAGKGILFGNAWRDSPVDERKSEVFPDNVIVRATALGMSLVSSTEFFTAYCEFLQGKKKPEQLLSAIFNTKGDVRF